MAFSSPLAISSSTNNFICIYLFSVFWVFSLQFYYELPLFLALSSAPTGWDFPALLSQRVGVLHLWTLHPRDFPLFYKSFLSRIFLLTSLLPGVNAREYKSALYFSLLTEIFASRFWQMKCLIAFFELESHPPLSNGWHFTQRHSQTFSYNIYLCTT